MALWQVVCGLCAVLCVARVKTHREPFASFKAPRETIVNYQTVVPLIEWTLYDYQLLVTINSTTSYTLKLHLNKGLLSPKFSSRYHDHTGRESIQKGHRNCFYHGVVVEEPEWTVALSTCLGLRGSFGPGGDPALQYHIEPLHHHLGSTDLDQPHVLYLGSEYTSKIGTCGTKGHVAGGGESEISHHMITSQETQRLRRQRGFAIVEWTLVNDNAQYLAFSSNLTHVVLRAIEIANGVDLVYKVEHVRVTVVDVITWTVRDPFQVVTDATDFLNNFRVYSPSLPQNYDSAMLFTGIEFDGRTVGIAYTATICENLRSSVGLVQDGGGELDQLVSTTAHELGHIFSMDHDTSSCTCTDVSKTCIMAETVGSPPPTTWSSCSVDTLRTSLGWALGMCLDNEPGSTVTDPACGNGIQEEGEACDCGTVEECVDPCCNATSCQLAAGAQCRAGKCCQPDCQYREYGSVCRSQRNECDIEEYCMGDSGDCPKDMFLQNLSPCMGNDSFCFSGHCQTRDNQCQHHFGTDSAIDECYTEVNTRGIAHGHCGYDKTDYFPCSAKNAFCGQIQCRNDGMLQSKPGIVLYSVLASGFTCSTVTTLAGSDEISPGLIQDGTKCGEQMICLNTECVSTSVVEITQCPTDSNGEVCSGQGQCNNENQCSCFVNFRGTQCDGVESDGGGGGRGGGANGGAIAGAVIAVLVTLAIVGGITAAVVYFVVRSRSASYVARRYIPKTTQSATRTTSNGTRNSRGVPPVSRLSQPTQPPAPTRPDPPALTRPDPPYKKPSAAPQRPPPPSIPSLRPPPPAASPSPLTQNNNPGGVKPTPAPRPSKLNMQWPPPSK